MNEYFYVIFMQKYINFVVGGFIYQDFVSVCLLVFPYHQGEWKIFVENMLRAEFIYHLISNSYLTSPLQGCQLGPTHKL